MVLTSKVTSFWAPKAPVLVLAIAGPYPQSEEVTRYSYYDLGQAVALLTVEAGELGLQVHQMGGFDAARARTIFGLPETLQPMTVLAVGYPGSPDDLAEPLRARELAPRTRKPLAEVVFKDDLGNPLARAAEAE